ncbi:MAG: hypothetical protein ACLQBB_06905 [Solirubrobacteraceae bacterium]
MKTALLGVLALGVLGATTASAASAKQVGLFEPQTGTQVSASQKLGTFVAYDLEGGRAECHVAAAGDLEPWLPEFEPPPLRTTIFYRSSLVPGECSSEVAGETVQMNDAVPVKIEVTGLGKATEIGSARVYEYQPGGLYCTYGSPYKAHLTSPPGEDRSEWAGTVVFKRIRLGSDSGCAETVSSAVTIDVGGQEAWDGEALETKRVS